MPNNSTNIKTPTTNCYCHRKDTTDLPPATRTPTPTKNVDETTTQETLDVHGEEATGTGTILTTKTATIKTLIEKTTETGAVDTPEYRKRKRTVAF